MKKVDGMSKDSNVKDCLALSKIVLLQWVAQGVLKSKIVIMSSSEAERKKKKHFGITCILHKLPS